MNRKYTVTLTFGDQAENHKGMQQIGNMVNKGDGFNLDDFYKIIEKLNSENITYELHELHDNINIFEPAYLLIIKKCINHILTKYSEYNTNDMFNEQINLNVDKKAYMYGRVVNKNARWNLCFDDFSQEPDYELGKGRIISYDSVPIIKLVYNKFGEYFGDKALNLKGEGNYYYDITKCGIGFHGDSERRKVIALRLGASLPIYYQWYKNGERIGNKMEFVLDDGDIYIMSEKSVGTDWKKKSIYTLRHATGCNKFIQ